MATENDIVHRVRRELGDLPEPFRQNYRGTGTQDEFDLPVVRVSRDTLRVFTVDPTSGALVDLTLDVDFTLGEDEGVLRLIAGPLVKDMLLVAEGSAFGMFTDVELQEFVHDALLQHTNSDHQTTRYRDANGFIRYERVALEIANLPEVEHLPVAILATIEALWMLSTDAATDIDVNTSEGTFVPRSQRYSQLRTQIELLTEKYHNLCSLLNVGLYRIEVSNLRRVSRLTGRLVAVFVEREYDETTMPTRITPEIDTRGADFDGPPSPAGNMGLY